jgi:hypothetical protein
MASRTRIPVTERRFKNATKSRCKFVPKMREQPVLLKRELFYPT